MLPEFVYKMLLIVFVTMYKLFLAGCVIMTTKLGWAILLDMTIEIQFSTLTEPY